MTNRELIVKCSVLFLGSCLSLLAQTNVLTQHNDIGRTGQNLTETILTPANVSSGNFGKLYSIPLDGQAYAQPLYVSSLTIGGVNYSVLFVATENDSVYAFDTNAGGSQLWHANLIDAAHGATLGATPDPNSTTGCGLAENGQNGIVGTPVIDPVTNTVYAVARSFENGYPVNRLHAIDITTGNEKFNGPITITASTSGTGSGSINGALTMDPKWTNQRPGLLLAGSGATATVYIGFGSFCDAGPYHGWLLGYSASTLKQTYVYNSTPNGSEGAFWSSGAGIAADTDGANGAYRLFIPTGNGSYDASSDFGESVLRLGPNSSGVFGLLDSFTFDNQAYWTSQDLDMGSAGTLVLPDTANAPHLAVQLNKTGEIFVLNRENLGGYQSGNAGAVQDLVTGGLGAGLWGIPAYWNGNLYYWSNTDYLRQYSITNGVVSSSPIAHGAQTECGNNVNCPTSGDFGGSTPSISANGAINGIVWVDDWVMTGNPLQNFYAYNAQNVGTLLWSSNTNAARDSAGAEQKFAVPTIADGKVFLASRNAIQVYGLYTFTIAASQAAVSVDPGGSTSTSIALAAASGYSGEITLSASNLPAGVTVSFAPGTGGNQIATFTAAANAAPGTTKVTLTGTSPTNTQTVTIPLTVGGFADFAIAALTPASVGIQPGGANATTTLAIAALGGFAGTPAYSVTGLPSGVTGTFSASALTLTAATSAVPGAYPLTITAVSGALSHSTTLMLTVAATSGTVAVNLANSFNVYGIFNDGSPVTNGGLASSSYAYSANFLNGSLTWVGVPFALGQANVPSAATSKTIPLPAGTFGSLNLLGSASYGPFTNQPFAITYTDGSSVTTNLSLSDWSYPQSYSGESVIATAAYRVSPNGAPQGGTWNVYGYSIPLNTAKTVQSVTLPNNADIVVLAMTLSQKAPAPNAPFSVSLSSPTVTLSPSTGGTYGVTITPAAGFNGSVSLSLNLPTGVNDAFINQTSTGATLVLYVQPGTTPGTYPLTLTGTSGNATATAPLSLVIPGALQSQTITFNLIPAQTVGSSLTLTATASSGLAVTYTVVQNGNCSVSGAIVTFLNVGNCGVIANQAGNSSYSAAATVGQIVVVNNQTPQTITFNAITAQTAGSTLTLTASASSGLAIAYSSSTASVCTISGSSASLLAAGTCTITASQAGNGTYSAATPVSQSFKVNTAAVTVTGATLSLTPGNGGIVTVTISGLSSAPNTLGLGGTACVNVAGCQYYLSSSSGVIGFEFLNVTNTSALLVAYVPNTVKISTTAYSIPITIGTTTVGTFKLTVP